MADDDLKLGMPVEHARQDQPNELETRLTVPADPNHRQGKVDLVAQPRLAAFAHRAVGDLGIR